MSIKQNRVIGQGETLIQNLIYKDADGAVVDLTGYSASLIIEKAKVGTAVGTYAGTVNTEGEIGFNVPDETTALWAAGKYAYRVVLTDPAGDKRWLVYGALTVIDGNDV